MSAAQSQRPTGPRGPRRAAFTLIEVLFAVALTAVSAGAMYGLLTSIVRMKAFATEVNRGITLTTDRMEALLQEDFGSLQGGSDSVAGYHRIWTVGAGPIAGTKEIVVNVAWTGADGHTHARQSRCLVSGALQ